MKRRINLMVIKIKLFIRLFFNCITHIHFIGFYILIFLRLKDRAKFLFLLYHNVRFLMFLRVQKSTFYNLYYLDGVICVDQEWKQLCTWQENQR